MTNHANELRRHARKIPHPQGETPGVMLRAADEIERLAATLEATEEDRARFLVEMGRLCAQCDALRLRIKAAEKERDALRAELDALKSQEPVAWLIDWADEPDLGHYFSESAVDEDSGRSRPLFLHPVPASVPEGWQLVPIEPTQEMLDATSWPNCAGTDYKKMLAAAPRPEAKP